ncbi:molybdenum cofactor biosynthesis protein MoaE [soil metagenome]
MQVTVRLFAMLRERAGWRERDLELAQGATVGDAWAALVAAAPAVAGFSGVVRFARNGRYAPLDERLQAGDELAVIPPVAGGAAGGPHEDESLLECRLTDQPIDDDLLGELRRSVPTAADGALLVFVGQTRETPGPPAPGEESAAAEHAGERVAGLEYEAYPEMAVSVLREIGREIEQHFAVRRLVIVHRTGRVGLSEPSVVIAAAAPHRAAAFDACRYAIEQLKARAPIWKREVYEGGGVWSGASPADRAAED